MRRLREHREPLALTLLSFALALWQRPGIATSDTKIDLHVDPVGFLADVASLWNPSGDLGHVHGGQYSGYLFPMGPFFALGHQLGLAPWLVHRLWLGTLLALAALGGLRLAAALLPRGGAPARLTAALVLLLNPYVVVFTNRTSITLLAYALLPWMLLAAHRGLRSPRSWWWPGMLAVIVASAGGGVNVAVLGWLVLVPLALAAYEPAVGLVRWSDLRAFALRAAPLLAITSAWWVAPVAAHALYGHDFLPFTEQPGAIWGTTGASEVLRLMGYWTSYVGVGFSPTLRPYTSDSGVMLFSWPVLVASLLVPAFVAAALAAARRWIYAPYCLGLLLAGALIVGVGFPDGTPLRRAALAVYFHVGSIQFLRTSYKAAPFLVIAYALLLAAAAPVAWRALARRRVVQVGAALAGVLVLAVSAYPLVRGKAIDRQLTWRAIPPAWTHAASDLDAQLPANRRAVVLPGQLFGYNRWGATVDPILPALTDRLVAERSAVPFADLHAVDLLWAVDSLVQRQSLVPGQLRPLLGLLGAGAVVLPGDDKPSLSGAVGAADAQRELEAQLGGPARRYGPVRTARGGRSALTTPARVPEVQRFDLQGGEGLVRVLSTRRPTLLDGSAATVTGLAALGALPLDRRLDYAGDEPPAALRAAATAGADVVIGDSNRRQIDVPSRARDDSGAVLSAGEEIPPDAAVLDPFAPAGSGAQTVAEYAGGVRDVREDLLPGVAQFPEHRPFAAVDGDPRTSWIAPPHNDVARHWVELDFDRPRAIPYLELRPHVDRRGATTAVAIAGRRWPVHPGWNRLPVRLGPAASLRVQIATVRRPVGSERSPGGIDELRMPGIHPREYLRPPVRLESALRGADLRRSSLSYVFARTTGATPFRRQPAVGPAQARRARDRGDAEAQIARRIDPPAARAYAADGWATLAPDAADDALDRMTGVTGGRFTSSGRFEGLPSRRASRAFDGDVTTAWIAPWLPASGTRAWIAWRAPHRVTIRRLRLGQVSGVQRPTRVRIVADGRATPPLPVSSGGDVAPPAPLRGRSLRLEILAASFPAGTPAHDRDRRAVGIAEVGGAGVLASGAKPRIQTRCGALSVRSGSDVLPLRMRGTLAQLDAGQPLRAKSCGAPLALPAGPATVTTASSLWRPFWLRLRSEAPSRATSAGPSGGRVLDPGTLGRTTLDGVRLSLSGPAQLVLAESYDRGWRATCDGRDLGAPRPAAGLGNGWIVPRTCTRASFAYAPDRPVRLTMLVSGALGALLALALLVVRRPRRATRAEPAERVYAHAAPLPWRRALALAAVAGLAGAFLVALRAGPVVALAMLVVARRGIGPRTLALAAAALLGVAVPAIYLLHLPADRGGYAADYAGHLVAAHWVATAALVLLAFAAWRLVSRPSRRARAARAPHGSPDRAAAARDPARAA
ncbi:MAG TPA: alpha-(1-_3)-arabinofuranosyltransferase family protein [Solirubrobacteraceae bacterium]|nr:alpha-(1->3)-arabinofuranosyltransferase family protein [Solirubrobacteraceae bacterium]